MKTVYLIAPNISNPYLGPSTVAYNLLQGFLKIKKELEKQEIEIKAVSISFREEQHAEINDNITDIIPKKRKAPVCFTGEVQSFLSYREILRNADLVHSHYLYEAFPWLIKGIPTIHTLHGVPWGEKKFTNNIYSKFCLGLTGKRLMMYYPKLSRFVVPSPYAAGELISRGIDPQKVVYIENPISEDFFNIKKREENIILYPATLAPHKNQINFLKSVALLKEELKEFKIIFAGAGSPNYIAKLKSIIKKESLKNVVLLGKVPYLRMRELYSKASVVALVSFQENCQMALLEAMSTGTPPLASPVGIAPRVVWDGKTGFLVNPYKPKDIGEKLRILADDKRLRRKLGKRAKQIAEKRWKDSVIAKKHLALYLSLIN